MKLHRIALADTHSFSNFFTDYAERKEQLKPFYGHFPEISNFKSQIASKANFPSKNRDVLAAALERQYGSLKISDKTAHHIQLLKSSKTFTVTTGHQLNVFTGPLFFVYKIVAVINACRELKKAYPEYDFVPVFWMASEDHDYEEIRSFKLYGKKYTWHTEQTGAVGRFNPKSLEKLLEEVPGDVNIFREAYLKFPTLADSCRSYVNALFGHEGLVVVDGDDRDLKALFKPVIHEDLFEHTPKKLVEEKNGELTALGYHTQVFARDINLFYLDNGVRARIERHGDTFRVLDTSIQFSEKELAALIESNPEKFSPNVILRPVYQECILPNLAYVGGPAEMIYWLQLKGIFDHLQLPFPILLPRCFALYMEKHLHVKWEKTGLSIAELFKEKNFLFNHWVLKHTRHDLTLGIELKKLAEMIDSIKERAHAIDTTLEPLVAAESVRMTRSIEKIERKMLKAEKRFHKEKLQQIEAVKDALFPGGGLQERTDNFLNFFQKDPSFINKMIEWLDPFDLRFNVICDD